MSPLVLVAAGPDVAQSLLRVNGSSNGRVNIPIMERTKQTFEGISNKPRRLFFDRLTRRAIHWKVYFHDIPQTTVLVNAACCTMRVRYFYIDDFFTDARGAEREFPQFCLIEPDYMGSSKGTTIRPMTLCAGVFIADVYSRPSGQ